MTEFFGKRLDNQLAQTWPPAMPLGVAVYALANFIIVIPKYSCVQPPLKLNETNGVAVIVH